MLIVGMGTQGLERGGLRWSAVAGLLTLSLLMAAGSLRLDLLPNLAPRYNLPADLAQAGVLALIAAAAAAAHCLSRLSWPGWIDSLKCGLAGLGLFAAPALARSVPVPVPELTLVALYALVAVFAAVLEPYLSGADTLPAGRALPAAIACAAGAFSIFPVEVPPAMEGFAGLLAAGGAVAAVAAANCLGVSLLRGNPSEGSSPVRLAPVLCLAAGAGALGLALTSILGRGGLQAWPRWSAVGWALTWRAAIDVPAVLLLFWLMRRMPAVQMALRFVIGPLIAVAVEALAMQQLLSAQTAMGLLLGVAGCWWMLRIPWQGREMPDGLRLSGEPED